jgi:LacI family transcriptional regulator
MRFGERQNVTLEQVAREAGVSLATASRVLNGNGARRVRPHLRDRVLESAAVLDYTPNAHAQVLAVGGTTTIGMITHDVSDPYFAAIARGAMRVAMEQRTLVLLASTFRDPAQELAHVSVLRAQRARAILLLGSGFQDVEYIGRMRRELDAFVASGGRVAMVSQHDLPYDAVLPDNRGGARALGRSLLELGHRNVSIVTGPRRLITIANRLDGFCGAFHRAGAPVRADRIVEADFSQEGGYAATLELLDRGDPGTALFCVSDVMAVGALQALRERGVRVPGDLSVAGFDDIPIVSQLTPPLSTVALPLEQMGEQVISMVLAPPVEQEAPRSVAVPAMVVLRGTTAGVRRVAPPVTTSATAQMHEARKAGS